MTAACRSRLADDARKCEKSVNDNPELAVQGCTALISSGQLIGEDFVRVLNNRGLAYSRKGNYDLAIQDFDAALRLKPAAVETLNNRGVAHEQRDEFDLALQDYDQAILLKPTYAAAFNNRALIYADRKGDHEQAIKDFDQAIRLQPDYAEALSNRAHSYYANGEYERAIQDYNQAIKLEPNYNGNFFDRAAAFSGKKDYGRAMQDLDHALQLRPNDPSVLWVRGIVHFLLGGFEAAKRDLDLSLKLRPGDPYCVIWLYLTSARTSGAAKDELKENSTSLNSADWPAPAIRMFLGLLSAKGLVDAAGDADGKKSKRQQSQAYFYLAEEALTRGKSDNAEKLFQQSVRAGSPGSYEYIAARAELDRLKAER